MSVEQLPAEITSSAFFVPDEQPTLKLHGSVRVDGAREEVPWTAEFPEEITYNGLTLLIPGFGGIKRSSRDERHANATTGRPTASYDPARISGSVIENLTNSQDLHTRTAEAVMFAVQDEISSNRTIPNRPQLDGRRVIASVHSMGGFAGTALGLKHPGLVESVIYKGAAGFWPLSILDMQPLRLAQAVNRYVTSGRIEPNIHNLYRIVRYYGRDLSRTTGEAVTCLTTDITEQIAELADHGVTSAYLAYELDELVSAEIAREKTKGLVGRFSVLGGIGHLGPQSHPDETAWATWDLQQSINNTGHKQPVLSVVS